MLDPTPVEPADARKTAGWHVPLILDLRRVGDLTAEQMPDELRFWLFRHGLGIGTAPWFDITGCLVDDEASQAQVYALEPDRRSAFFSRDDLLRGLVFEIPTKTAVPADQIPPGFYDLKVLPRMNSLSGLTVETPSLAAIAAALHEGDWLRALQRTRKLTIVALAPATAPADLRAIAHRIREHPSPHFAGDLRDLRDRLEDLATVLDRPPAPESPAVESDRWTSQVELALSRTEQLMRVLLESPNSLAPVALEDPTADRCDGEGCVRFAVAGDLQHDGNIAAFIRFLGMFDAGILQPTSGPLAHSGTSPPVSEAPLSEIDFVLFVGDLADSAAWSQLTLMTLNVLGILPPRSPYGEGGRHEMVDIRDQLARFRKPFFAVPGNHDGYAGFGGILNVLISEFSNLVTEAVRPFDELRAREWGENIESVNDYIPTLVGWRLLSRQPRYDGLNEWQRHFGPLNLAFKFRGHSFVGLNSFDLTAHERAAVGGFIFHWGGGVQDEAVDWFEDAINRFAPDPQREQLVFIHHDPRGAVPLKTSYQEEGFGFYDPIDTPISQLTLGYGGVGNSPRTGLYWPLLTPIANQVFRALEIRVSDSGTLQQEWMRKRDWGWPQFDQSAYNARDVIEVINCNLAGRNPEGSPPPSIPRSPLDPLLPWRRDSEHCSNPSGNISYLFFAHNDVPLESSWADSEQRGALFREPPGEKRGPVFSYPQRAGALVGLKFRNTAPPVWAQRLRLDEDHGNATVLRLDDVGNVASYHGFHVVTLYDDGRQTVEWLPLAR
jgi:hypothetical protein